MKSSFIIGVSIILGLTIHAWITRSVSDNQGQENEVTFSHEQDGEVTDLIEYKTVTSFKQAAVEQLSGLKGETIKLNGQEYFYIFLVDESESGKGLTWKHNFYKFRNDTLVKIPID